MMADAALPPEVERFLVARIPSVAHLEALILIRAHPDQTFSPLAIAQQLYIDGAHGAAIAADLVARGVAAGDGPSGIRFAPAPELAREVDVVVETYRRQLLAVSRFLHARQDAANLKNFADAFRFRKD